MLKIDKYIKNDDSLNAIKEARKENKIHLSRIIEKIYDIEGEEGKEVLNEIDNEIKKEVGTRVMIMCNWCSSEELCENWSKMSEEGGKWGSIKIVSSEPCDYYCVINSPREEHKDINLVIKKTILFRMEPNMEKNEGMWGFWSDPKSLRESMLFAGYHDMHYNNLEWHLGKTYNELMTEEIIKSEEYDGVISTVLSEKYYDPGHIKRVDFVKYLEEKGVKVDVYGSNKFRWKRYKGELPMRDKNAGVLPYKYHFNCENNSIKNYITEKLVDGVLGECITFYSGCPNVREYISDKTYVYLELSNFEEDYLKIMRVLSQNLWERNIESIREEKRKILKEKQFFPRLERIIKEDMKE